MHVKFDAATRDEFKSSMVARLMRTFPCFRGDWLVFARLLSMFPAAMRTVKVRTAFGGANVVEVEFDVADPPQYTMVRRRRYDLGSALVIWSLLRSGDVFVDVGANFGYLSCVAAQAVGKAGLVISLEPNRQAFNELLGRGLVNVFPFNFAVGDTCGENLSVVRPFYRQSTGSFCVSGRGVQSVTLDYVYEKFKRPLIRFIKVDTEGMELAVLSGARRLLEERRPYVLLELEKRHADRYGYRTDEVFDLLKEFGYCSCYLVDNRDASVRSVQGIQEGDFLFSTEPLTADKFGQSGAHA